MLVVHAPVAGTVRALAALGDPVFRDGLLGPGLALEPADGVVRAPVTGEVVAARAHAFVARADGRDVLVHLGLEARHLGAAAFALAVVTGDRLVAGAAVGAWDPGAVVAAGASAACAVVALQADPAVVRVLHPPGAVVAAGEPVLEWL